MVPRWIRAGSRGHEKSPRLFQVRGVEFYSRGTTLVQPPVTRTALKASNKAAAGNGARRPDLLYAFGQAARGPVIHREAAHRFAPTTGSLNTFAIVASVNAWYLFFAHYNAIMSCVQVIFLSCGFLFSVTLFCYCSSSCFF